uniref:Replicative DNA helicase n=1 Tax=uncultured marine virus TaxID=186617 RepID=A0A0F7L7A2_9VIRU|nr:replicative DNA helicase [uncultured marine virus]
MNAAHEQHPQRYHLEQRLLATLLGPIGSGVPTEERREMLARAADMDVEGLLEDSDHRAILLAAFHLQDHQRDAVPMLVAKQMQEALDADAAKRARRKMLEACALDPMAFDEVVRGLRTMSTRSTLLDIAMQINEVAAQGKSAEDMTALATHLLGELLSKADAHRERRPSVGAAEALDMWMEGVEADLAAREDPNAPQPLRFRAPLKCLAEDWYDVMKVGRMPVIAARSGVGKSALSWEWAKRLAWDGMRGTYITLEMPEDQKAERLIRQHSPYGSRHVWNRPALLDQIRPHWQELRETLGNRLRIHYPRGGMTITGFRRWWLSECRQYGKPDFIVVDHLHRWSYTDMDARMGENQKIAEVTAFLKDLAITHECMVILLSQMNREFDKRGADSRPILSDLYGSKAIEQDADAVLFLHRPQMADQHLQGGETAQAIVAKNREGPLGTYEIQFLRDHFTFVGDHRVML